MGDFRFFQRCHRFGLFNNRIDGTLEYYNTKTTDLLTGRSIPTANGFSNVLTNIGEINNRGVEITLNTVNVNKNDFRWTSSAVFSSNKNEIVHLYGSDADGDGREDDDLNNRWFIGQPIGVNFDYALMVYTRKAMIAGRIPSGMGTGKRY